VRTWTAPPKLVDAATHGPDSGAELFVVEGDSAAGAVAAVRDPRLQAVLPMQGKPLNPVRASDRGVAAHPFWSALTTALGGGWGAAFDLDARRYARLLVLTDPDADGIHCGALVAMFLYRWMPALVEHGHVHVVRAPVGEIEVAAGEPLEYAWSEPEFAALCRELRAAGRAPARTLRYRGLASLDPDVLRATCVAPATRNARPLTPAIAEHALATFGAKDAFSPQRKLL
jgi:DNA gyrase subunit B/topoisomerase-4 subunit B